jgi:hypothetical protein
MLLGLEDFILDREMKRETISVGFGRDGERREKHGGRKRKLVCVATCWKTVSASPCKHHGNCQMFLR